MVVVVVAVAGTNQGGGAAVTIRRYVPADALVLGQLMFDSVHQGAAQHYNAQQRQAWMPEPRQGGQWQERLADPYTLVAEDAAGAAGFMTLASDGYIDLAFVRPDCIGRGVAAALYQRLEEQAGQMGIGRLYCEASELAKPFFARRGWQLVATQEVIAQGVALRNHKMEKLLG